MGVEQVSYTVNHPVMDYQDADPSSHEDARYAFGGVMLPFLILEHDTVRDVFGILMPVPITPWWRMRR